MRATRRRDTAPELKLRRELHALGLRFRVDAPVIAGLRRRGDIVFAPPKVVVLVHGCFWHCCPQHATTPKANASWWSEKLATNRERDRDTEQRLKAAGWEVITVWEHEDMAAAAKAIALSCERRRSRSTRRTHPRGGLKSSS